MMIDDLVDWHFYWNGLGHWDIYVFLHCDGHWLFNWIRHVLFHRVRHRLFDGDGDGLDHGDGHGLRHVDVDGIRLGNGHRHRFGHGNGYGVGNGDSYVLVDRDGHGFGDFYGLVYHVAAVAPVLATAVIAFFTSSISKARI